MIEIPLFNDSEVERVLCVVAHPDDMEYGGSAAVAKWTDEGKEVAYLLLTRGEAGIRDMQPDEVASLRADEQRRACNIVGVDDLEILDFPDGLVEPTHELRRAIARKIREYLELVCGDPDLRTSVLDVGEGVAISVKKGSDA